MSHYDEERNLPDGEQLQEEKLVVEDFYRKKVKDKNGHHIGPVENVFVDDVHGQPEWVTIKAGFMGMKTLYIPVSALENINEDELVAPWDKEIVLDSPAFKGVRGSLSKEQEMELFRYYNIDFVETKDGEEVLDEELVEAEEEGRVNAPGDQFYVEGDEAPDLAALQQHISEERRENLVNGDGDHLMNERAEELDERGDRVDPAFDVHDPEPLEETKVGGEPVKLEEDAPSNAVEEKRNFTEHDELEERVTVTPVPMEDVKITRVEDGSPVQRGGSFFNGEEAEKSSEAPADFITDRPGSGHGIATDSDDAKDAYVPRHASQEQPNGAEIETASLDEYKPRHLKAEDGE